jgi:uncharacterized protein YgbK (DUF1537 family)
MNLKIAIVADDLTGALDSAAPFPASGWRTMAALAPEVLDEALSSDAAAVAVNTLTRHLEPAAAAVIAGRAAARCVAAGARLVIKKIDSRMRGNVGAEATAVADALGVNDIVVAPAVPAQGRIVTGRMIRGAGVAAEGIDIGKAFSAARSFKIEIPDSRSEEELDALAASCIARAGRVIVVGAHGIAAALARQIGESGRDAPSFVPEPPVLVVVGSQDPATAAQVSALALCPGGVIIIEAVGGVVPPPPAAPSSPATVLRSVPGAGEASGVAERFAEGVLAWWTALRPRTLVATGGDTAAALLDRVGCRVLEVGGEVAPGIPWSRTPGGATVVTKSGGFGRETTLLDLLHVMDSQPTGAHAAG